MFLRVLIATVAVAAAVVSAGVPPDSTCINWKAWSYGRATPNPNEIAGARSAWVIQAAGDPMQCLYRGLDESCVLNSGGQTFFGHHDYLAWQIPSDYCRAWNPTTNQTIFATEFYLPFRGPRYKTIKTVLVQTGAKMPPHAIRYGNKVMAVSTQAAPGHCAGKNFGGWAEVDSNDILGKVHFSIVQEAVTTTSFLVVVCTSQPTTTITTTQAPPAPTTTQPAPNSVPYIRFVHAVPTSKKYTCTITQGGYSHTWKDYSFAQFSGWERHFKVGDGEVSIIESATGKVVVKGTYLLTPGPLICAIKGTEPLNQFSIEMVAASYVPAKPGMSGVRLFNLCPDCVSAGMKADGKKLVDGIKFTVGSKWAPIKDDEDLTYEVFDDQTGETLASDNFTPPASPMVFTNFLLGTRNATKGSAYSPRLIAQIDAPEV